MDETIPDVGFSIGTIQRKKTVSKDTNPETFWNNFDKLISITKLKLENSKWGPGQDGKYGTYRKTCNPNPNPKSVTLTLTLTLTVHDFLVFSKYYTFHSLISMVL
jgi:hypothetical protein